MQVLQLAKQGSRVTVVHSSSSSRGGSGSTTSQQQQQQQHPADAVVIAAGVDTAALCEQLGYHLPLLHKPAAIVITTPLQPGTLQHMVVSDDVFILQVCLYAHTRYPQNGTSRVWQG
jgi:glycine/D-amino acid oxidase-like deaminating enzyme